MEKQLTYIYQAFDIKKNDFIEIDILHDKIDVIAVIKNKPLYAVEYWVNVTQFITIKNKPSLKMITKCYFTEYELKRLFLIADMKGVKIENE